MARKAVAPPAPHDPAVNWPKGWWSNNPECRLGCIGRDGKRGHKVDSGQPIYLTGTPGGVFCEIHAPEKKP